MERFELVKALDDVRTAKSSSEGMARLMLGMHCMERDEAWHVLYGSAADAAERLGKAEARLEVAVAEINASLSSDVHSAGHVE